MKIRFAFLYAALGLSWACFVHAEQSVRIDRDQWGVPHISGPTDASVIFGYAYAQAQDNFWQIEDTAIQALGRYSEIMGESALGADYLNRSLGLLPLAKAEYAKMDLKLQSLLQAAADGVNRYLEDSQTQPRLINHFEPWHFLAISRFTQYQLFVFNRARIQPKEIAAFASNTEHTVDSAHFLEGSLAPIALNAVADAQAQAGSNTWALSPERTRSGNTYLFINPHQPFFGPGQWHEGHLHSQEGLHISGAGFFGSPFPTIGRNQYLGWSHTVNEPDIVDVYALTLETTTTPYTYRWAEETKDVEHWTDTITVRLEDGSSESRSFNFLRSHHGPIVAQRGDQYLAVKMAQFVEGGQFEQRLAMWRSKNLDEFKQALARLATPMFNTMYADVHGDIYYAYYGAVPIRDPQFDWTQPVDGHNPATQWRGYHPLEELPTYTNPASGYLQNCNATPFLATGGNGNLKRSDFPDYMVAEEDNNRSRMSRILLGGDKKFSFKQFDQMTWDTRVLEADTMIPLLVQEVAARDLSNTRRELVDPALKLLTRWDRYSDVDSRATTLYFYWRFTMRQLGVEDPVDAFSQAILYMEDVYGSYAVPWGAVNRSQRQHTSGAAGFDDTKPSLPIAGGPGNPFGVIFNFYSRPQTGNKRMYGVAGHSYVSIIEFAEEPVGKSIVTFGSSADPESAHYYDQAQLYARKQYKPAWFTEKEVRDNSEDSIQLVY